jgi:hypothetical protein
MVSAQYLHRQAENCLRIARTCFDLASAERMRHMANDLKAQATELEKEEAIAMTLVGHDDHHPRQNREHG